MGELGSEWRDRNSEGEFGIWRVGNRSALASDDLSLLAPREQGVAWQPSNGGGVLKIRQNRHRVIVMVTVCHLMVWSCSHGHMVTWEWPQFGHGLSSHGLAIVMVMVMVIWSHGPGQDLVMVCHPMVVAHAKPCAQFPRAL